MSLNMVKITRNSPLISTNSQIREIIISTMFTDTEGEYFVYWKRCKYQFE